MRRSWLVAGGLVPVLALTGCAAVQEVQQVQQSNEFVDALNAAQQELVTVTSTLSAAGTPRQFAKGIDEVIPAVERKMEAVEAAQQSLPPDLAPVGETCVASMQAILKDLEAISSAARAGQRNVLRRQASALQEEGRDFGTQCVDAYNAAAGVG